jgi:asparagine synthase (glutamine-hydrolysing)
MIHAIRRRGPDDNGFLTDAPVALGMACLSIVDPEHGHQPILSEDGQIAVVCNGEIYSHPETRPHLEQRGHAYRTNSDVETIVHLFAGLPGIVWVDSLVDA